ncbi:TPA_asm: hypothetical protein [Porphyromonas phage phage024a_F0570]|uniref:Uncharacterized protein n=1 Tax=Porphyromonas phage phage024a_F0570 TaxID=3154114 RepID=A0AAT9JD30_9CAUD
MNREIPEKCVQQSNFALKSPICSMVSSSK